MDLVQQAVKSYHKKNDNIPKFSSGDTVEVYVRVKEGEKERIQVYRGIVIKIQGSGVGRSFTVRKISDGIGVERTFPFMSPIIDKLQVIAHGQVRRSRLFYLRDREGKAAKVRSELAVEQSQSSIDKATAKKAAAAKTEASKA